ncbi:MAG: hypothetical protein PW789_00745 [Edaphobacter sp.]|uniref:hypothetical protein n=1 Tax=Edaphobacter sp. TaxID=1934404 RepID=UPI0023A31427|nr:hypothetical protein [Edaphobacter sp.]MDE1175116.1 hypothetical protein [Edaphobacter sp.]
MLQTFVQLWATVDGNRVPGNGDDSLNEMGSRAGAGGFHHLNFSKASTSTESPTGKYVACHVQLSSQVSQDVVAGSIPYPRKTPHPPSGLLAFLQGFLSLPRDAVALEDRKP